MSAMKKSLVFMLDVFLEGEGKKVGPQRTESTAGAGISALCDITTNWCLCKGCERKMDQILHNMGAFKDGNEV